MAGNTTEFTRLSRRNPSDDKPRYQYAREDLDQNQIRLDLAELVLRPES
jgi:hypothetical protein